MDDQTPSVIQLLGVIEDTGSAPARGPMIFVRFIGTAFTARLRFRNAFGEINGLADSIEKRPTREQAELSKNLLRQPDSVK